MKKARFSREETQARILDKADALFRQVGFGKTTISDIAKELGMSPANIYKFFPSKNALVQSCALRNLAALKADVSKIAASSESAFDRIEQSVLTIFRFHNELFRNERQIYKLVLTAMEEQWPCIKEYNDFLRDTVTQLVEEGMKADEFQQADPRLTAETLLDCLRIALHPHMRHDYTHDQSEERVLRQIRFLGRSLKTIFLSETHYQDLR
jgi:AcrR family transcriptional regulator